MGRVSVIVSKYAFAIGVIGFVLFVSVGVSRMLWDVFLGWYGDLIYAMGLMMFWLFIYAHWSPKVINAVEIRGIRRDVSEPLAEQLQEMCEYVEKMTGIRDAYYDEIPELGDFVDKYTRAYKGMLSNAWRIRFAIKNLESWERQIAICGAIDENRKALALMWDNLSWVLGFVQRKSGEGVMNDVRVIKGMQDNMGGGIKDA